MTEALTREIPIRPEEAAVLFIDVQNYTVDRSGGEFRDLPGTDLEKYSYYFERLDKIVIPNLQRIQHSCRRSGVELIYVVIENLTADGRERSLDYKISGIEVARGSWDARLPDALAPDADEIILRKSSSSAFVSTNVDYTLRNLGKRQVILCGVLTDQCVESAVRDACDLGYLVTLVPDACATYTAERQAASIRAIRGYCRQIPTAALEAELGTAP